MHNTTQAAAAIPFPNTEGSREKANSSQSSDTPSVTVIRPGDPEPQIDEEYIKKQAFWNKPDALQKVLTHHGHIFDEARKSVIRATGSKLANLKEKLVQFTATRAAHQAAQARTEKRPDFIEKTGPEDATHVPLGRNIFSIFFGVVAFGMILLDPFACAIVLVESGIATFVESPWKAWLMSSAPLVIALVTKALVGMIEEQKRKKTVTIIIGICALIAALWWGWIFSTTFPSLGDSVDTLLTSFDDAPEVASNSFVEAGELMVLLQILAGGLGGVALFEYALLLRKGRRKTKRVPNKRRTKFLRKIAKVITEDDAVIGPIREQIGHFESLLEEYAERRQQFLHLARSSFEHHRAFLDEGKKA